MRIIITNIKIIHKLYLVSISTIYYRSFVKFLFLYKKKIYTQLSVAEIDFFFVQLRFNSKCLTSLASRDSQLENYNKDSRRFTKNRYSSSSEKNFRSFSFTKKALPI